MYKTTHSVKEIEEILNSSGHIFFIGIGGVSMSSLAHISIEAGFCVSGSDRVSSPATEKLEAAGARVFIGHDEKNIEGADAIVYTAAIPESNPELRAAEAAGVPLIYRADYLGYIMSRYKTRIGISGMHGKSTATSMTTGVFMAANADPTVVSGAATPELDGFAYRTGGDSFFIMEACEYCDSFLSFTPNIAVVLNVEMDHPDYFKDIEQIKSSFRRYLSIAAGGYAVINGDDPLSREVAEGFDGKVITFGLGDGCDYTAKNTELSDGYPEFEIYAHGKLFTRVKLGVTGDHNIMNALVSAAVADICGLEADAVKRGLESFRGASRRMESRGKIFGKAELFDDYAHHPTEIKSTLKGVLKAARGRVWCVYQPHTYTRTAELFDEFTRSFDGVRAIFADIYAAREVNTTGISSKMLADKVSGAVYLESFEKIAAYLEENVEAGDTVIVMGAGDIIKLSDLLVNGDCKNA